MDRMALRCVFRAVSDHSCDIVKKMKEIRVFPRKTNATPIDEGVRIAKTPSMFDEADEIHISVSFTWDLQYAEWLYNQWKYVAPTDMGGAAITKNEGDFIPGKFLKAGNVITSRGCPNKCWFCSVWKRNPILKELEIKEGWIIQDDNLLACSDEHIKSVFKMLSQQKEKAVFTGGLEAKRMKSWIADELYKLKPSRIYFAYDTPDDYEPLVEARKILKESGFKDGSHDILAYVLIGYPRDTFEQAEERIMDTWKAGYFPYAMLYRDKNGEFKKEWRRFQRKWILPQIIATTLKNEIPTWKQQNLNKS